MKHILILTSILMLAAVVSGQNQKRSNESIIRDYFGGFVKKDWKQVAAHLDDSFTFTSPAPGAGYPTNTK